MNRMIMSLMVAASTLIGCAAEPAPAPTGSDEVSPATEETSQELVTCDAIYSCSKTHQQFERVGPNAATQARLACQAACSGGTCSPVSIECDP